MLGTTGTGKDFTQLSLKQSVILEGNSYFLLASGLAAHTIALLLPAPAYINLFVHPSFVVRAS